MLSNFLSYFGYNRITDPEQFILISYRSHIVKRLASTYYSSDKGWGCMLRVGQMAIANLLHKRQHVTLNTLLPLFWDNSNNPFSIQTITSISSSLYPNKKHEQWYSPCEVGFILKQALESFSQSYSLNICNDNSVFLSEIRRDRPNVVILLMCRIGMNAPEQNYLQTVILLMKMKYFFAILGGTPRYAHLFFKERQGYMGYLDPHTTSRTPLTEQQLFQKSNEYVSKLQWVKKQKISSSMAIMFVCTNQEIDNFWVELNKLKQLCGEAFFLYLQKDKPIYDSGHIIQVLQEDQL